MVKLSSYCSLRRGRKARLNKKTYYFLGLGSGLIIGALLISLMTAGQPPPPIDQAQLQDAAERHGFRLVDENSEVRFGGGQTVVHAVYIHSHMSLEEISEMFASMQLLEDQETFLAAMYAANEEERTLKLGYHEFYDLPTVEQLVQAITGE